MTARQPVVKRCQHGRVGWDATEGRNGGPDRAAWETLLDLDRSHRRAGEMDQGAITLVL